MFLPVERSMTVSAPQRVAHVIFSTSSSIDELTAELPMLALIFTRKLRPMIIGSLSGWLTFAGRIARPRATSARTNSGSTFSRSATNSISGVISPRRSVVHLRHVAAGLGPARQARRRESASRQARTSPRDHGDRARSASPTRSYRYGRRSSARATAPGRWRMSSERFRIGVRTAGIVQRVDRSVGERHRAARNANRGVAAPNVNLHVSSSLRRHYPDQVTCGRRLGAALSA